jgi:hypothetical protein
VLGVARSPGPLGLDGSMDVAVEVVGPEPFDEVLAFQYGTHPGLTLASRNVTPAWSQSTLVEEPGTTVALIVILALGLVLDLSWKESSRSGECGPAD